MHNYTYREPLCYCLLHIYILISNVIRKSLLVFVEELEVSQILPYPHPVGLVLQVLIVCDLQL